MVTKARFDAEAQGRADARAFIHSHQDWSITDWRAIHFGEIDRMVGGRSLLERARMFGFVRVIGQHIDDLVAQS